MPCDFCHDPKPTTLFPANDFVVDEPQQATRKLGSEFLSRSGWAACAGCAPLIEADDYDALLDRAIRLNPAIPAEERNNPDLIQVIKEAYAQFRASRTGPPY